MKVGGWPNVLQPENGRRLSRYALSAFFIVAGVGHFVAPQYYDKIMPPWLPEPRLLIYISGLAEIAGGAAVPVPALRKLSGLGLILLLVAVFPANIQMLLDGLHGKWPRWMLPLLFFRLPFQPLFIWWVWSATLKKSD